MSSSTAGTRRAPRAADDGDSGVALVELGLLLPFLAVLVFGTVDLGRAYSLKNATTNMAREGAFQAMVDACPVSQVESAAKAENDELASKVTVKVAQGSSASGPPASCPVSGQFPSGTQLTVVVTTKMRVLTPLVGAITGSEVDVSGTGSVRLP